MENFGFNKIPDARQLEIFPDKDAPDFSDLEYPSNQEEDLEKEIIQMYSGKSDETQERERYADIKKRIKTEPIKKSHKKGPVMIPFNPYK